MATANKVASSKDRQVLQMLQKKFEIALEQPFKILYQELLEQNQSTKKSTCDRQVTHSPISIHWHRNILI